MTEIHKTIKVICFVTANIIVAIIDIRTYSLNSEFSNSKNNTAMSNQDSSTSG